MHSPGPDQSLNSLTAQGVHAPAVLAPPAGEGGRKAGFIELSNTGGQMGRGVRALADHNNLAGWVGEENVQRFNKLFTSRHSTFLRLKEDVMGRDSVQNLNTGLYDLLKQ